MAAGGTVLVVGADGEIGTAVARQLEALGTPVARTSRRGTADSLPLDLAAAASSWALPSGVSAAVLCAAVSSTEACWNDPVEARRVNVEATLELARRLAVAGSRLVFLSTNLVFDGSVPFVPADAPRCPRTAYGRMKAEVETELFALDAATTVVRLTKVVGRPLPVFTRWREALARGEPVHPFSDMVMAPVTRVVAASVIAAAAREPLGDILQVSARADVSYAEVARRLAVRWGFSADLVKPMVTAGAGLRLEHVPSHTTLDPSAVRDRLGLQPPDPWAAVEEVA